MTDLPKLGSSLLLTAMYFVSGATNFGKITKVASGLRKRTFEGAPLWLFQSTVVAYSIALVAASIAVVYSAATAKSRLWGKLGASYLFGFTVLATFLYHWPPSGAAYYAFISNVTACGGLWLIGQTFCE
jgi:hypothetical protein